MTNISENSEYRALTDDEAKSELPRISYDMREHKKGIIISWSVIFTTSGILPIVLYFALRYGAKLDLSIVLALTSALFGAFSLFSLGKRTWDLTKKNSKCRPLGASRWSMDFFNINFIIGFIAITIIVVVGNITLNVRIVALGLPVLVTEVCAQLLIGAVLSKMRVKIPFRISSVPADRYARSGVYVLAEDIIAVDGGQGQTFRQQLNDRYNASSTVRRLCSEMDFYWGISGTAVGLATIVLVFAVSDENVGYVIGWAAPWGFAAVMAALTVLVCKARLRHELHFEKDTSQGLDA